MGNVTSADISELNLPSILVPRAGWHNPFLSPKQAGGSSATSSILPSLSDVRDSKYLTQFIPCVRVGCFCWPEKLCQGPEHTASLTKTSGFLHTVLCATP